MYNIRAKIKKWKKINIGTVKENGILIDRLNMIKIRREKN